MTMSAGLPLPLRWPLVLGNCLEWYEWAAYIYPFAMGTGGERPLQWELGVNATEWAQGALDEGTLRLFADGDFGGWEPTAPGLQRPWCVADEVKQVFFSPLAPHGLDG
eukprot:gene16175-11033_t